MITCTLPRHTRTPFQHPQKNVHYIVIVTINSRRNLSSSRAAGEVLLFECCCCKLLATAVPVLKPFAVTVAFDDAKPVAVAVIKFSGPRRSRRKSSNCLVNASTLATAKLSSFSFSLNSARIESRSLPERQKKTKKLLFFYYIGFAMQKIIICITTNQQYFIENVTKRKRI